MAPPGAAAALVCLFFLAGVYFLAGIFRRKRSGNQRVPPGDSGWPLLGHTIEFFRSNDLRGPERFVVERRRRFDSGVFRINLLGENTAIFCGAQGNKFLFGNEGKLVALWWPAPVRRLFGRCLINSAGDEAKRQRRMLLTFLAPEALSRYVRDMDEVTRHHFAALWNGKDGEAIKVYPTVKLYAFELACRLFASIEDPEKIAVLFQQFNLLVKGIMEIPLNVPFTRFYRAMRAADGIRRELRAVTRRRAAALADGTASPSQDLLSHMLVTTDENGKHLSEEEIVNNILTVLFAGHDTSTSAITVILRYLAELPQVYDQVFQEQMNIAMSKEPGELLQWEDIQKMKYTWNVVCEVLRLTPPVVGNFREALTDFTYEGYTIPKGWKLYWSAAATHKDATLFQCPEKFDASRFEAAGTSPYSFVPFGGGPRMCLGKEYARVQILLFLHNLVKRFKWDLALPDEIIKYDPMPIPEQGLPIHLRPHQPKA